MEQRFLNHNLLTCHRCGGIPIEIYNDNLNYWRIRCSKCGTTDTAIKAVQWETERNWNGLWGYGNKRRLPTWDELEDFSYRYRLKII